MSVPTAPQVSVVIPCYNAEAYVCATIESVLAQGLDGLEVVVVDDGSRDGSVQRVRAAFPHVRVIEQPNQGVAAARNHGLREARGEWIALIDADDIWLPGKLRAQLAQLHAAPGCRMSYTAWQVWPSSAARPDAALLHELEEAADDSARWRGASGWIYPQLLLDCVVWTSTVLAHRSLFDEIGDFDTSLRIGEDYDLWLRASRVTPILRVERPFALYRIHPASITKSRPTDNYRARVIGRALEKWGMQSPDGQVADSQAVHRMLAKSWSDYAGASLQAGDFEHAKRSARHALRYAGTHVPGWKVLLTAYARAAVAATSKGKA